jgi:hypothetical protein
VATDWGRAEVTNSRRQTLSRKTPRNSSKRSFSALGKVQEERS